MTPKKNPLHDVFFFFHHHGSHVVFESSGTLIIWFQHAPPFCLFLLKQTWRNISQWYSVFCDPIHSSWHKTPIQKNICILNIVHLTHFFGIDYPNFNHASSHLWFFATVQYHNEIHLWLFYDTIDLRRGPFKFNSEYCCF